MIHREDSSPQIKQDIDLLGLKTVASLLETQLSVLFFKRTTIQQEIHRFRIKFNEEVGEIVNEILDYRRKMLFDQKDVNPDKNAEYEDAEKDFEESPPYPEYWYPEQPLFTPQPFCPFAPIAPSTVAPPSPQVPPPSHEPPPPEPPLPPLPLHEPPPPPPVTEVRPVQPVPLTEDVPPPLPPTENV